MTSSASFLRNTLIMLAIGVVVLLTIVVSSIWLGQVNNDYSEETAQFRRIRSALADLYRNIQDSETGQRGYMLTGDVSYLAPYNDAVTELATRQKRLAGYVANYPEYESKLTELDVAIAGKMAEITKTVELGKSGRMTDALALIRSDVGRKYMLSIRQILDESIDLTDARLRILVARQLGAASTLSWVIILGAVAILLLVAGAAFVIFQHVRDLSRAREELAVLNRGLEARVTERTRELIRANQEIQRFAYIVTHDLRAPLVNIMGFLSELDASLKDVSGYVLADSRQPTEAEILQARSAVREDVPEAMGFIRASTRKMDGLINAILKISRDGRRQLQADTVELEAAIRTAADSVQHQVGASGGEVRIVVRVRTIITDRTSLEQILGNLFDNAVKYRMPARPLQLSVDVSPDGRDRCQISVTDNGRGIAPEDHERIFELFRRAGEQNQPGEGIGLAYVRSLVRNLGGDIAVSSAIGVGSTFVITLPTDLTKVTKSDPV